MPYFLSLSLSLSLPLSLSLYIYIYITTHIWVPPQYVLGLCTNCIFNIFLWSSIAFVEVVISFPCMVLSNVVLFQNEKGELLDFAGEKTLGELASILLLSFFSASEDRGLIRPFLFCWLITGYCCSTHHLYKRQILSLPTERELTVFFL
jgi:hypothetical protein